MQSHFPKCICQTCQGSHHELTNRFVNWRVKSARQKEPQVTSWHRKETRTVHRAKRNHCASRHSYPSSQPETMLAICSHTDNTQTHSHMKLSRTCPGHISPQNQNEIRNNIMHEEKWRQIILGPDFDIFMAIKHIFSKNLPNNQINSLSSPFCKNKIFKMNTLK